MQSSQMICSSCRRQLVAAALQRARLPRFPLWQARPPIRSASSTTHTASTHPVEDFPIPPLEPLDLDSDITEPWATSDDGPKARDAHKTTGGPDSPGRFSAATSARRKPRRQMHPMRKNSLKIFENVVKQQTARETRAAGPLDLSPESVEYYSNLAKLRPMMKEQSIEDCLEYFLTKLWNKSPFDGRNHLLKQRGTYLMSRVATAKMADIDNPRLPKFSQLTHYLHEMESLSTTRWSEMMMGLIRAIITLRTARTEFDSEEAYTTAMLKKEGLVEDLVDSWIAFHRYKMSANHSTLQSSEEAEFRLPDINFDHLRQHAWRKNYKAAFGCIFPEWTKSMREIPAVAIATFVLLVDNHHSTVSARQKAKPLLIPVGHVVTACRLGQSAIAEMLEPHPTVLLYVLKQWDAIITRLHRLKGNNEKQEHRREASITSGELTRKEPFNERRMLAKIRYALGMNDVLTLEAIWRDFWGPEKIHKAPGRIKDHPKVFNYFVMAFTALRKPNRAIDTWDAMTSIGLFPTLHTWSCMIEGCRKCRNGAGIENVWRKLVASGLPLDEAVWTSRILGLMEAGEPDAGLRALNELHAQSKLPGSVPLGIKAINAAVIGLLRLNSSSAAHQVLTWASGHGIRPDVFTFNILLGQMVRYGQVAKIKSTLKMMSANNIKPNTATYTILLEGLMSTADNPTPAQQQLSVEKLIADMEKNGAEVNQNTLARMLHLVLHDGKYTISHTEGAIGAIFKYLDSKELRPSPHMLTMLVDHYFAREPPAIQQIDLLLQQPLHSKSLFDRVFWERIIKGYSLAGATDRAFACFEKTCNISSTITLDTAEVLLRALVHQEKWAAAARVVDDVKRHRGASIGDVNNSTKYGAEVTRWHRYWRHGFWGYAMDCGLLSAAEWRGLAQTDGMPPPSYADL